MLVKNLLVAFLILLLGACSGPAVPVEPTPVPVPEDVAPPPSGPGYTAYYFDAAGLQQHDLRVDATTTLLPNSAYVGPHLLSPDGRHLAVGVSVGGAKILSVVDLEDGTLWDAYATDEDVVYTAAWSRDGLSLAFGYYTPQQQGEQTTMGPGAVQVAALTSRTVADVGCADARAVVAWLPQGDLVVRDDATLRLVDPGDCSVRHTLDVRRMHHLTFSPDGQWMAYIFRDLVYNREARTYEPDSTLFVADYKGEQARTVVGYRYRPRNLAWAPDGTELAYDAQSQEISSLRSIALYNVAQGVSAFLHPPDEDAGVSETHPSWSPSGARMAFNRVDAEAEAQQKVVRIFAEPFARVLAESEARTLGWAGEEALLLHDSQTGYVLLPVESSVSIPLPSVQALLHVQPHN